MGCDNKRDIMVITVHLSLTTHATQELVSYMLQNLHFAADIHSSIPPVESKERASLTWSAAFFFFESDHHFGKAAPPCRQYMDPSKCSRCLLVPHCWFATKRSLHFCPAPSSVSVSTSGAWTDLSFLIAMTTCRSSILCSIIYYTGTFNILLTSFSPFLWLSFTVITYKAPFSVFNGTYL
jgi:hypothetical protein